jgi:hypothetical protein
MEICRRDTLHAPGRRKLSWPDTTAKSERQSPAQPPRFARATIGFWLGAVVLGTAGCIPGGRMPYQHPVAVVLSALWWGVYLGCFGGSVGAVAALLTERARVPPSGRAAGPGQPGPERAALPCPTEPPPSSNA